MARQIVNEPEFLPPPNRLWDAAIHPPAPDHWQAGITWIERCTTGGTTYDECLTVTGAGSPPPAGPPPPPPPKADNINQQFRGAQPFTVFAEFDCSPVGLTDIATVAAEALNRVEHSQVERAFWTGTAGGTANVFFPHLTASANVFDDDGILLQPAATILDASGLDPADALGQLQQALDLCSASRSTLYIPRMALPTFAAWGLVYEGEDGLLRTLSGNRVVVSGWFPGTRPTGDDPAAGTSWIYGTGPLFGYRSDVRTTQVSESFNRAENTVKMIAERTYLLGFSCCLVAVLTDLGVPTT